MVDGTYQKHHRLLTDIEKKGGRTTQGLTFPQIAQEATANRDTFYGKAGSEKRQYFVKAFSRYKKLPIHQYLEALEKYGPVQPGVNTRQERLVANRAEEEEEEEAKDEQPAQISLPSVAFEPTTLTSAPPTATATAPATTISLPTPTPPTKLTPSLKLSPPPSSATLNLPPSLPTSSPPPLITMNFEDFSSNTTTPPRPRPATNSTVAGTMSTISASSETRNSRTTPGRSNRSNIDLLRYLNEGFQISDDMLAKHTLPLILDDIPSLCIGTVEHPMIVPLYTNFDGMQGDCHILYVKGDQSKDSEFDFDSFILDTVVHAPDYKSDMFTARMWHDHPNYEGRAVLVKAPFHPVLTTFRTAFYKGISSVAVKAHAMLQRLLKEEQKIESRYTLYIFPPTIKLDNAVISKNNEIPLTFTKKLMAKHKKYECLETDVTFHEVYWRFAVEGTVKQVGHSNEEDGNAEEV